MFRFSVRPNRAHMIDWREWGEDAFEEARGQDKLVVLFIAAFWCGFCQRMDETALSNDETIALLNGYVSKSPNGPTSICGTTRMAGRPSPC